MGERAHQRAKLPQVNNLKHPLKAGTYTSCSGVCIRVADDAEVCVPYKDNPALNKIYAKTYARLTKVNLFEPPLDWQTMIGGECPRGDVTH